MKRRTAALAAIVFLSAGAAGMGLATVLRPDPALQAFLESRIDLPDVTLLDQRGKAHPLKSGLASDGLVVISFNYSTCDSICPLGNEILAQVDRRKSWEVGRPVRLISITIDPRKDTPDVLAEASKAFSPSKDWFWVTGGAREIASVLTAMNIHFPEKELHEPVFFIGDAQTGEFLQTTSMNADAIFAGLKVLGS